MALMLPLLLVMMFATFEGGYFLWSHHKVVKGVRDGARYAGRLDFSKYTCPSSVDPTILTSIKNVTRTGYPSADNPNISGTDNPTVYGWSNDGSEVAVTLTCVPGTGGLYSSTGNNAPIVTVAASVPYPLSPLTGLTAALGIDLTAIHLNASAQSPVVGL